MSWHFYKHETGWAIWSTVVEDWIVAGLSEQELIDYYTEQEAQSAREKAKSYVETIKQGKDPYRGFGPDEDEADLLYEYCGDGE